MVMLKDVVEYADNYLQVAGFDDYCPNGLQIEGKPEVKSIISGVTASQALIDSAIAHSADLLLVHHGYFWKGENPCLTGMKRKRIAALLESNISLLVYHLPLDQHLVCGNNAQLAAHMGWRLDEALVQRSVNRSGLPLVCTTTLDRPVTGAALTGLLSERLARKPLHIESERLISRIGWCTGGAQGYLMEAIAAGVDAFVSGEISEQTVHEARENNIHYYAAGHHATERYGVHALGEHLANQFDLQHQFIDCENPV